MPRKEISKFSPCICGVQMGGAIILQRYPSTHVWLKKNELIILKKIPRILKEQAKIIIIIINS
jgi:hypothetical protein